MKKILSIDGGGIRGIIPGQVIVALEEKLQQRTQNPDARVADFFDFFAGTSTGGILTCIYLCPSKENPGKAKFSAKEAVQLYRKFGGEIFHTDLWQSIRSLNGMYDDKYNASALEKLLKEYFGDTKLSELLKPCIITAYDVDQRSAHFFAQHDYKSKGAGGDFYVRDVCRATSAAPTYFEVALLSSLSGVTYPLVDGGVFANNPALCAYSEVRNSEGQPTAKDMFVLSIGTGSVHQSYKYEKVRNFGSIRWIRPVIDIMMAGASETTDYHLKRMFAAAKSNDQYVRMQPDWMRNANLDMDDASENNLDELTQVGIETAQHCWAELDKVVDVLLEDTDPVIF